MNKQREEKCNDKTCEFYNESFEQNCCYKLEEYCEKELRKGILTTTFESGNLPYKHKG